MAKDTVGSWRGWNRRGSYTPTEYMARMRRQQALDRALIEDLLNKLYDLLGSQAYYDWFDVELTDEDSLADIIKKTKARLQQVEQETKEEPLHQRRREIMRILIQYQTKHGYPPSLRELVDETSCTTTSVVHFHLNALEEAGYITRTPGIARPIRILKTL